MQRAYVRSRELRRLLLADLNNDRQVSRAEVAILIPTESVGRRARLLLTHRAADVDHNDVVDWDELRIFADAKALSSLTSGQAANMRSLMQLDHDGDGRVSIDEVILTVQAFRQEI